MTDIARYYDASKQETPDNPASIPGVPLADLDQATFDALPEHIKADVDASGLYRKTAPDAKPKRAAHEKES